MELNNVKIGDKFKIGNNKIAEVVDFSESKSLLTGKIIKYNCYAKLISDICNNIFEIPFSHVVRYRIESN